jgi:molybdate transport system substrate-binding protein
VHRVYELTGVLTMAVVLLGGCGKSSPKATATAPSKWTGSLTVFAASSLTEAFNDEKRALTAAHPSLRLTYSFAGSSGLVQQITQGAPADVFASADEKNMQELVDAGVVDTPRTLVRNKLEIVVQPGNPKHVAGLSDLGRSDLRVVLVDPTVPAGTYSQQALNRAGVTVRPRSQELDVKSAVARVTSGEADAAIVYATDVKAAGAKAAGVSIVEAQNVIATYPIAVVKASTHRAAAEAFVEDMVSGDGQEALTARGFIPPR